MTVRLCERCSEIRSFQVVKTTPGARDFNGGTPDSEHKKTYFMEDLSDLWIFRNSEPCDLSSPWDLGDLGDLTYVRSRDCEIFEILGSLGSKVYGKKDL